MGFVIEKTLNPKYDIVQKGSVGELETVLQEIKTAMKQVVYEEEPTA